MGNSNWQLVVGGLAWDDGITKHMRIIIRNNRYLYRRAARLIS